MEIKLAMNALPVNLTDDELWQAVLNRDARYSGKVFYAVRSTGIYCRVDCPSRRPRRDRVTFYGSCDAAEQAGYRPCRRCHPCDDALPAVERAAEICRLLEQEGQLSLIELGRRLNVSPYHLQRSFKSVTGTTPRQYAANLRSQKLKDTLRNGHSVVSAQNEAGYGSSSRLYETAAQDLGMTPGAYRRGGENMNIQYTIVALPLIGQMLVAGTQQGICAVTFGDDETDLEQALAAEYPRAVLARDETHLTLWVEEIVKHLKGHLPHLELPIDVQATAFQLRVWDELRKIPYGETRTYAQVAGAMGQPGAVRAVAHACASNPAALVTPCHRVVRSDGSMGGYRWGIERKEVLLAEEKRNKEASG